MRGRHALGMRTSKKDLTPAKYKALPTTYKNVLFTYKNCSYECAYMIGHNCGTQYSTEQL